MIAWFKLQATFATNSKVAQAGPDGALVYLAALCQHVQHGHGGKLPASRLKPAVLRIEAVALLGKLSEARIAKAVAHCVEAGLLQVGENEARICGYDAEAMPQCLKCRGPNNDHRFATCPACREKRGDSGGKDAMSRHVATSIRHVATDRTGLDPTGPDRTGEIKPSEAEGSSSPQSSGSAGSSGSIPSGAALHGFLLNQTTWRANARERLRLVTLLASRLAGEGCGSADLATLWSWALRNAKDPSDPGGYFDSLVHSEAAWRSALAQAKQPKARRQA